MASDLQVLQLWQKAVVEGVRSDAPDLSARQMALLLSVYLQDKQHTVRGLAAELNISKPAISRALDRLGELGFIRRKRDEQDRRNVLVQRTVKGSVYLTDFAQSIKTAAKAVGMDDVLADAISTQSWQDTVAAVMAQSQEDEQKSSAEAA